jgi:hypothetical protein
VEKQSWEYNIFTTRFADSVGFAKKGVFWPFMQSQILSGGHFLAFLSSMDRGGPLVSFGDISMDLILYICVS